MATLCMLLLLFVSLVLIGVILLQRGRGGGLAGALGGMGGASALGTRAGDVFTAITCGVAVVWVLLACVTGAALRWEQASYFSGREEAAKVPESPMLEAPATDEATKADGATKTDGAKKPDQAGSELPAPSTTAPVKEDEKKEADKPAEKADTPAAPKGEEAPKAEAPKAETPKEEAPKPETPAKPE